MRADGHHQPESGDEIETWLKNWRDKFHVPDRYWDESDIQWQTINEMLDDYRLHADTGTAICFDVTGPDVGG